MESRTSCRSRKTDRSVLSRLTRRILNNAGLRSLSNHSASSAMAKTENTGDTDSAGGDQADKSGSANLRYPIPPAQEKPPIENKEFTDDKCRDSTLILAKPNPINVVPFPTKTKRGRKKKSTDATLQVDYVKASKNTWAFRIRWTESDGQRPVIYVSRVSDKLFNLITKGKVRYAQFKKQLIASYKSRTVRESDRTNAGPDSSL